MREPLGLFPPQTQKLPPTRDIRQALADRDYAGAVAALDTIGMGIMQGERDIPLSQLFTWLDQFPAPYSRSPVVLGVRAWLSYEQMMPTRALLIVSELAAQCEEQLAGPEGPVASMWLMAARAFQGTLYESEGRNELSLRAYTQVRSLLSDFGFRTSTQALALEPEEAERLIALDHSGVCAVVIDALAMYQAASDRGGTARMAHHLGQHYLDRGEPSAARYWLERSLELRRGRRGELPLAYTLDSLGMCYAQLGLMNDAQAALDEAMRIATNVGSVLIQAHALSNLGDVYRDRNEFGAALELYRKSLALKEQMRDTFGLATTQLALATCFRRQREFGLSADAAAEAGTLLHGFGDPSLRATAVMHREIAGTLLGNDGARDRLARIVEEQAGSAKVRDEVLGQWYLALASHEASEAEGVRFHLDRAFTLAMRHRHLHLLAMEIPISSGLCKPAVEQAICPEALAGLVLRATPQGLAALLEHAPSAAKLVAAAGRLGEATALTVKMLGAFRVMRAGREIDLTAVRSQKAVSLLKFLVASRGKPVIREQILEAIWPEAAPEAADRSFEVTVSNLRKMLDPVAGPPLILRKGRGYLINPEVTLDVDVDRFVYHVERGNWWWQRGQTVPAVAEWQLAENSYRGDYLAEDPYDDWATAERERLRELYMELASRLGEQALCEKRYEEAIRWARQVLANDSIRDTAFRLLMRAHARQGNRAVALRDYRRYTEALARELGEEPAPETRELARLIRAGEVI
ncbi:MAG TPA: BTAD domain-containing putative transcriptional regulator [Symbiobacteriaceae bacterium]|jgi:DNA-binding SARP family transcriptional activator/tetratricopeptide (TPR) repeat protein